MFNKEISGKQYNLWVFAALSAPLAQIAAGCSWNVVLFTGSLCSIGCWILYRMGSWNRSQGKWLRVLQLTWTAIVLSQLCRYPILVWPKNESPIAVPLTLLALAAWSADRGIERAARAGNGMFWFLLILYSVVAVSAAKEVRVENLSNQMMRFDPMLVVIFLIPAVIQGSHKGKTAGLLGVALFALLISVITIGALSMRVVRITETPFYELSRSISFLGIAERFESLVAAAMTLGYFVLFSLLLSNIGSGKIGIWVCSIIAAICFVWDIEIYSWYLMIGSILMWFVIPMANKIIMEIKYKKGG